MESVIREIMTKDVVTIDASSPANHAAKLMGDRHVGCLIVTTLEGKGIGIITERDLVWKIMAESFDPSKVVVSDIMTTPLITISSDKTLENAAKIMTDYRIRRLPVVDRGKLVGLITTTDLVRAAASLPQNKDLLPILNAVSRFGRFESSPYA